jgi:hypothetical protein
MVTVEDPVFETITGSVLLLPNITFPKLTVGEGVIVMIPPDTPVPETGTMAGEFVALLTTVRLPAILPVLAGVKTALNPAL